MKKVVVFLLVHFQYLDLLDLFEFQDYLSIKSKYIKYQIKDSVENDPNRKR